MKNFGHHHGRAGRGNNRRPHRSVLIVGAVALLGAACSTSTTTATAPASTAPATVGTTAAPAKAVTYPGAAWEKVDPAAAGFDAKSLATMATTAEAAASNCLLVTRNGKIVQESYFKGKSPDEPQEVFSATKSYTAILVGIAQADGKLKLDDSASKYIPEWKGTPAEKVTVKNLISNNSGRHWDYESDYFKMAGYAENKNEFAIALPQDFAPGEAWTYNNSAIQTLSAVLFSATGKKPADFATEKLLGPIGMTHSAMTADKAGNTLTFMGLQSTCRDMARFGYLMLNKGTWDGKQIVPAAYVDEATTPSQKINAGYGYMFWLNRKGKMPDKKEDIATATAAAAKPDTQALSEVPENVFWALGLGDQTITVFPDTGVVAVRLGPTNYPEGSPKFSNKDLTLATQQALTKP